MTAQEIHDKIQEKFPEVISEFNDSVLQPYIKCSPKSFNEVCQFLRDDDDLAFDALMNCSGVDYGDELGVVYHLYSMNHRHKIVLKVNVSREQAEIPTVADIWRTADWHEREIFDLYGIHFTNHPDMRRILLPDDWEGYPLRKDYVQPQFYNGIEIAHPDMKGNSDEEK